MSRRASAHARSSNPSRLVAVRQSHLRHGERSGEAHATLRLYTMNNEDTEREDRERRPASRRPALHRAAVARLTRPGIEPGVRAIPFESTRDCQLTVYHRRGHDGDDDQRRELLRSQIDGDGERRSERAHGRNRGNFARTCPLQNLRSGSTRSRARDSAETFRGKPAKRRKLFTGLAKRRKLYYNSLLHGVVLEMDAACWLFGVSGGGASCRSELSTTGRVCGSCAPTHRAHA